MKNLQRFEDQDGWRVYAESADHFERGEFYLSVTKVLDHVVAEKLQTYMKTNSAGKQAKHLQVTADLGTRIHACVEKDLKGEAVTPEEDCVPAFKQWQILREAMNITAVKTEQTVYHPHLFFAGTCDIIGSFRDVASGKECKEAVMDLKTGFYSVKAGWQMAAYYYGWQAMGNNPDGMVGLSVHRNGSIGTPYVYTHIEPCYRAFLSSLETFKMLYWNKLSKMNWIGLQTTGLEIKNLNNPK